MLWEASFTTRTVKTLPRRHKHAYSSGSSYISNHELAMTSTHTFKDMKLGSGGLGTCFMAVTEETQSHKTIPRIGAGLSPLPNNEDQVPCNLLLWTINVEYLTVKAIAEFCPSVPVPSWLDDTLATLPPSHPVRRLILPLDRPIVRDFIDHNPGVSVESSVFAFQAPHCENHPLGYAGSDGHSGATVAVTVPKLTLNSDLRMGTSDSHGSFFEVTHNGSVELRENTALAGLRTVPFSTPGPGCAISRASAARRPWRANSILLHTTDDGSQEAMVIPPPFSTPGPFVSPRPVSSHVFGNRPVTPHMLPDEVYPTIHKSSAVPILRSPTTKSDSISAPLFPVQDGRQQFSAFPSLVPGFTSNNLGRLFTPAPSLLVPCSFFEGLSSSPTPATELTFPGDRGMITPSPDLPWLSPVELTRRSGVNGNIAYDDVSMSISDDLLGQKTPFGAFSLFKFPKHEAETLPGLRRHMAASDTSPWTPMATPPPQSMLPGPSPTNFDFDSPDVQSPESSESINRLDVINLNAYTPVAVVPERVRETSGIFTPTPGILVSPLPDAPDSRGMPKRWPTGACGVEQSQNVDGFCDEIF